MDTEPKMESGISPKLWIIGGLLVVPIILILGVGGIWFLQNQVKIIPFDEISKTKTETVPIGRKLIHGELSGKIVSEKSFTGRKVALCTMEKARVLKKGDKIMLECPNKGVKTTEVKEDNTFAVRLLPDSYIVTITLEGTEKSIQIPTQIEVTADTNTILPIVVSSQ